MKKLLLILLAVVLCIPAAFAEAEVPQLSNELFSSAKQALVYLSSGEYERLVTLLPFSDVAPSASEWRSFAAGNFSDLSSGVQTDYAVAYWMDSAWKVAVPVQVPDGVDSETLVLTSTDGIAFSGYRYSMWSQVKQEYQRSDYVTWNKEFVESSVVIVAD